MGTPDRERHRPADDAIDRYLDGELDARERAQFERDLETDHQLAETLRRLSETDHLVRAYAQDPDCQPSSALPEPPPPTAGLIAPRAALTVAAAALVFMVIMIWNPLAGPSRPPIPQLTAAQVYNNALADFTPAVICDTPEKFNEYTLDTFGTVIAADFNAGVELIGWTSPFGSYQASRGVSAPRVLLAKSPDGQQVIAVFTPTGLWSAGDSAETFNIHRARVGGLTVYELSELDQPVILPLLSKAP